MVAIEQDLYVSVDGYRVRYREAGSGPPLLLVHGLGNSLGTWMEVFPSLAKSFRVIALDLLGHGWSDMPREPFDLPKAAAFLAHTIDALGIDRSFLAGSCMGGEISLALALLHPEKVRALVLVDSAGLGREITWVLRGASVPGIGEVFGTTTLKSLERQRRAVMFDPALLPEWFIADLLTHRQRIGSLPARLQFLRVGVSLLGQLKVSRLDHRLGELKVPLLIIWGRQDPVVPVAHGLRAAKLAPDAKVLVFDQCGHWPQIERPAEVAATLQEFFLSH